MVMEKDNIIQMIREALAEHSDSSTQTTEKAHYVAEQLLHKGIQPSWRLIREVIGTGSASTLQNVVNDFWGKLGKRIEHLEKRHELPEPLIESANHLWSHAVELANNNYQQQLKEIKQHSEDEIQAIKKTFKKSQQQLAQCQQTWNEEKIHLEQLLTTSAKQFTQLEQQYNAQLEKDSQQQQQLDIATEHSQQLQYNCNTLEEKLIDTQQRYTQQYTQQQQENERNLERQESQYKSMLDYYGQEIGRLKGQMDTQAKEQRQERQKVQQQQQTQQQILATLQGDNHNLKQQKELLQQQLEKLQSTYTNQQIELTELHKSVAHYQAKNEMYQEYNQQLLQQELDCRQQLQKNVSHPQE
jgi:chromosome segregation ATPase